MKSRTSTPASETPPIECGEGWAGLYEPLLEMAAQKGLQVLQVKEKFGGLRFYAQADDELDAAIQAAQVASFQTCEVCGRPGQVRLNGWVKTLCDFCQGWRRAIRALEVQLEQAYASKERPDAIKDVFTRTWRLAVDQAERRTRPDPPSEGKPDE